MSRRSDAGAAFPPHLSDSAGQPWAGRHFEENASSVDDGSAPAELDAALRAFAAGAVSARSVVDAARDSRFLIPLVAHSGEEGENEHGVRIDKKQELSIVTVAGPDGRDVLPVFTSVSAMARWNPKARPVPADGRRVALAAAHESTEVVVIDAVSDHEFAIRRPALWAMAQGEPWIPPFEDDAVIAVFRASVAVEVAVTAIVLESADPRQQLRAPETAVVLTLVGGLDREALGALLARLGERWAADEIIAARVDSLTVRPVAAR
ncbi:SseB family protein [Microbacteriaceae bacterium VKM Ac-2855]|nr:SseB family protein [Microbacteriaceae bacterium VKM Ac-2855]